MFINDGIFNNHVKNTKKHIPFVTTSNLGNTYSIQIDDLDYLEDGQPIRVKFNAASTGAISIITNGGTAKPVVDYFNNPVTNVRKGLIANLAYSADDSNFQLQGKGGDGDALITDIRQGKKATTKDGLITGALPVQATGAQTITPGTTDIVKPAGIYDGPITIEGIQPTDIGGSFRKVGEVKYSDIPNIGDSKTINVDGEIETISAVDTWNMMYGFVGSASWVWSGNSNYRDWDLHLSADKKSFTITHNSNMEFAEKGDWVVTYYLYSK